MSYQGKHNNKYPNEFFEEEAFTFLKIALRNISDEMPFRGPPVFKEGDFEYIDESIGDINQFRGTEKILHKGMEVYRLEYHGGKI